MKPQEIKSLREKLNLTQSEFAEKLGTNYHTIMRWEKGYHKPSNLALQKLNEMSNSLT